MNITLSLPLPKKWGRWLRDGGGGKPRSQTPPLPNTSLLSLHQSGYWSSNMHNVWDCPICCSEEWILAKASASYWRGGRGYWPPNPSIILIRRNKSVEEAVKETLDCKNLCSAVQWGKGEIQGCLCPPPNDELLNTPLNFSLNQCSKRMFKLTLLKLIRIRNILYSLALRDFTMYTVHWIAVWNYDTTCF